MFDEHEADLSELKEHGEATGGAGVDAQAPDEQAGCVSGVCEEGFVGEIAVEVRVSAASADK